MDNTAVYENYMMNEEAAVQLARAQVKFQAQPLIQVKSSSQKSEHQNKNNFKWTYEEHAKYIYFLQLNKARIKSKLIRKSNAFFKQMEYFLQTKTSLQCRSHHQKFQQRYKFPHRIITGQKKYIPIEIYNSVIERAEVTDFIINNQYREINAVSTVTSQGNNFKPKESSTVSCQTDICDLTRILYTEEQIQKLMTFPFSAPITQPCLYYYPFRNVF